MKYMFALLILTMTSAHAEFYRSVDENGNVTFSDQPSESSEQIELKQPTVYSPIEVTSPEPTTVEEAQVDETQAPAIPNYSVTIISPKSNEAFWSSGGTVQVNASVQPALSPEREDKIQFSLDGKAIGSAQTGLSTTIEGVERGSHILVATVIDKTGAVLTRSKSTLFHLHKRSVAQ